MRPTIPQFLAWGIIVGILLAGAGRFTSQHTVEKVGCGFILVFAGLFVLFALFTGVYLLFAGSPMRGKNPGEVGKILRSVFSSRRKNTSAIASEQRNKKSDS